MKSMKSRNLTIRIVASILAVFIALSAIDCKQEPAPVEPVPDEISFSSEINVMLTGQKAIVQNSYKTDYFRRDARVFDTDLALLSCTLAASSKRSNVIESLNAMRFDNIFQYWNDYPTLQRS